MCEGPHPFIPVSNTAEVRMVFATPGGQAQNVFHIEKTSDWLAEDLDDLAQGFESSWGANLSPFVGSDITLVEVIATDMSSANGPSVASAANITGTNSQLSLPSNATAVVSFRTGLRGRSYRGRLYHVGLRRDMVSGDTIVPVQVTGLRTQYQEFFGDVLTLIPNTTHVVVSRCEDGVWRTNGVTTPVLDYLVENTVDSQRRRLKGRGI